MITAVPTRALRAIFTRDEFRRVLADLQRRSVRPCGLLSLTVWRLATCCGLRATEIARLQCQDVILSGDRPQIIIPRRRVLKRSVSRAVPLWWDKGTLVDLARWDAFRRTLGVESDNWLVALGAKRRGSTLSRFGVRTRFKSACRCLGGERVRTLTTHVGRHSYLSFAVRVHSLPDVMAAAGHQNPAVTGVYLHADLGDNPAVQEMFTRCPAAPAKSNGESTTGPSASTCP